MKVKAQAIPYKPGRTRHDRVALAARLVLAGVLLTMGLLTWILS